MYTDSHCHLSDASLLPRLPAIRQAMQAAQVDRALCICTTLEEFDAVHALALEYDNFWATVGVHPDNEGSDAQALKEPTLEDLLHRARLAKVVAIGETGLDYYRLAGRSIASDMQWQRDRFSVHIRAARQSALPLVVHTRCSSADTLAILQDDGFDGASANHATGVFHCFTESQEVARAALDMGFYISFSGILTFKNAADLREVARFVPLDRMLIETDSPYLAPMPHRGKTNDPSLVPLVAQQVASIKNLPVQTIAQATSVNFERLFSKIMTKATQLETETSGACA